VKLLRSPNGWSCLPASFAIAVEVPLQYLLSLIGHDGSDIAWPALREPLRRRSFHIQELIYAIRRLDFFVIPYEAIPQLQGGPGVRPLTIGVPFQDVLDYESRCVLTGSNPRGERHAVAWDGERCFDPAGEIESVEQFNLECIWAIRSSSEF
jgi:hypothetical protein